MFSNFNETPLFAWKWKLVFYYMERKLSEKKMVMKSLIYDFWHFESLNICKILLFCHVRRRRFAITATERFDFGVFNKLSKNTWTSKMFHLRYEMENTLYDQIITHPFVFWHYFKHLKAILNKLFRKSIVMKRVCDYSCFTVPLR